VGSTEARGEVQIEAPGSDTVPFNERHRIRKEYIKIYTNDRFNYSCHIVVGLPVDCELIESFHQ
jgi:hypothetical protein